MEVDLRQYAFAPRWIFVILIGTMHPTASAHDGPPFPVLVDVEAGPYVTSVWTDPDIGIATFFVVLEPMRRGDYQPPGEVLVAVRPVSRRLPEAVYAAEPQRARHGGRYYAEVAFDEGEYWDVWIRIAAEEGQHELHLQVEATPDGTIGPIGLLVYLLPFLALAFLWIKAMRRRRAQRHREKEMGGR